MTPPRIRRLPQHVADAIAAGEVVERPASVVKELIENALDAGAARVSVEIRGAGRTLIRVADDGRGMAPEDVPLAFERHATSKVRDLPDLTRIGTLGFRGEALASIAAVADVEISSGGRRVRVVGGRPSQDAPSLDPGGAVVEVRDLFNWTPARLRFLKAAATENSAMLRAVQAYALLFPAVRFDVTLDGRRALLTPGDGDLARAAAAIHGAAVAGELIPVTLEAGSLSVAGAVSPPHVSRGTRDGILLAVNGRPVVSRALGFALEDCFRGRLERGRHPICVLDLTVDPGEVDVNVHPAKREVRFHDEGAAYAALQRSVRGALAGAGAPSFAIAVPAPAALPATPALRPVTVAWARAEAEDAAPDPRDRPEPVLRPVGQVMNGYLVAEGADGLVLIDQHAAHERVLYNRIRSDLETGNIVRQPLLLAEVLELSPAEVAAIRDQRDRLDALGFEVEPFGPAAVRLLAAPTGMSAGRAAAALREIIELRSAGAAAVHDAAASIACHSAVRFGDVLDASEQRRLLRDLESAAEAQTCPHGRPTRLLLDWPELRRRFRRNY